MARFTVAMLVCSDLRRSRDFYRDVLGLKVVRDEPSRRVDLALSTDTVLSLHPRSDVLAVRPGTLQLGFVVENVDAFVGDCRYLGVPVFQDPYDDVAGRVAVIGDPDGYPIQIAGPRAKR
jgi:catechol 2,3-dioxygenase-like lactoylglutathione lyase family enzyme